MKTRSLAFGLFFLVVADASVSMSSAAKNSSGPANPIFQEILRRVAERDEDTDAILTVHARKGCSRYPNRLQFSISESRESEVVIILRWNNKINDGVYEKYRLVVDDAVRAELSNQRKFQAKLARIEEAYREERDKDSSSWLEDDWLMV